MSVTIGVFGLERYSYNSFVQLHLKLWHNGYMLRLEEIEFCENILTSLMRPRIVTLLPLSILMASSILISPFRGEVYVATAKAWMGSGTSMA